MAVVIGRPAYDDGVRKPDGAVFGGVSPAAVFIEVFVTDDVRGDIAGGGGAVLAAVAVRAPAIELVVRGQILDVGVQSIRSREGSGLSGMNGVGLAAAGYFALAATDIDDRGIPRFVDIDAVRARTKNREGEIGSIDLKGFAVIEAFDAHTDGTLGDLDLSHVVGEIQKRKAGGAAEANGRGAEV